MCFGSNRVDCERSIRKNQTALGVGFRTSFGDRNRNCENTPDMSFGSNGVDLVRSIQKINWNFFRSTSGQNGPQGRVSHEFGDRNRNCENTPDMSFGSNGVDLVRSIQKINWNFFRSTSGQNGPQGRVSHEFGDRNRNCENAPDLSFGSNGVDLVRSIRKINWNFFCSTSGQNGLGVGFRTSFGDRNRNWENTPDMSFGSNRADWVRSIRKNQLQFFSINNCPERPSRSGFA